MIPVFFNKVRPGDTILMASAYRKTKTFCVGVAAVKSSPDTWVNQEGVVVATSDPRYRLYKLTAETQETPIWKTLMK